jgi:hypothetical protein
VSIWVGRYAMVDGEAEEHGPWLVDRLRTRDEESVRVLVLAEPVDARSGEFCAEVAEAIAALFGRETLSITGGIQRALEQAHANLAEWNRRSLREHRVAVGITCVAIREDVATVAQVGPGLVYTYGPDGLRRLSTEGTPAQRPVGGDEAIEPHFTAVPLHDHQLLMLSSAVEREVAPAAIGAALAAGAERALPELFLRTRRVPDMTAVLVADLDYEEQPAPPPLVASDEPVEGRRVVLDAGDRAPAPERSRALVTLPTVRRGPRTVGRRSPRDAGRPWRRIGLGVAAAIVLAALAWAVLPGLLRQDRAAKLQQVLASGNAYLATASATSDAAQRRTALNQALAQAENARSIAPDDARVADLESRARAALAVIDAVVDVKELRPVVTFSGKITAPLRPAALSSGGGWLWMLDAEKGRVFRIDPSGNGDPVEVYRSGETYGGAAARDVIALAWEQTTARLLVFDAGRTLWAVDPSGGTPRPIALRGAAELRTPTAVTAYAGNLYVLDPGAGEVWRYLPAASGFDSERAGLRGGIDLTQASALAVDGDVYVLAGGTLRRFAGGKEQAPLLQGIDKPPDSPVGLVEDTTRGLLYVADRSQQRIVVGDKSGPFVRQFGLRGVALSGGGATVYVLTSDGISAFPALP